MATKITTAKKVATPNVKRDFTKSTPAKRPLTHAKGEACFWTTDGAILSNLIELSELLSTMPDEVFNHHVTRTKNDFADWIADVLDDAELASSLRSAKKRSTARTAIIRRLKVYDA